MRLPFALRRVGWNHLLPPWLPGPWRSVLGPLGPGAEPCPIKFSDVTRCLGVGRLLGPGARGWRGREGGAEGRATREDVTASLCTALVTWVPGSHGHASAEGHVRPAKL